MKYKNKRPRLIRCAFGWHIFIPGTHYAIYFFFQFYSPTGNRILKVTQTFSSLTSVTTGKPDITPGIFQPLHGKSISSNCNPYLGNILLIHFTVNPHRSRSPDLIGSGT